VSDLKTVALAGIDSREITGSELWEIHDLAQRVKFSRQNVGSEMRRQAEKVLEITTRIASSKEPTP
jgi:hypothetical protein